jgi:hypothetical protein
MTQPQAGHPASGSNLYRRLFLGLVGLMALALIVVLVLVLTSGKSASATSLRTEPISTAGADPFAPAPVGTDSAVPPVQTAGTAVVEGGHIGLYGGTRNSTSCDRKQLVVFLQQNPEKATAWASVLGIPVAQIPTYVDGLTPVLLRSDTLVTNHGYAGGRATVIPAVLQAGTAVLVDDKGFPVTKCYCGNPLTPPSYYRPGYRPKYFGPTWQGFSGSSTTVIQNNTTTINTFTLVDPQTRAPFERPRGTDGGSDAAPATSAQPPVTEQPSASSTETAAPETQSAAPQPSPTESGPSPEQRAKNKLNRGATQCAPFPAPIEQGSGANSVSTSLADPNTFVLTVVTHNPDGSTLQVFTWSVSRETLTFTPTNDLAQVASDHCSLLR